jgi:hypothetical protein
MDISKAVSEAGTPNAIFRVWEPDHPAAVAPLGPLMRSLGILGEFWGQLRMAVR